jgi:hypothetical protein
MKVSPIQILVAKPDLKGVLSGIETFRVLARDLHMPLNGLNDTLNRLEMTGLDDYQRHCLVIAREYMSDVQIMLADILERISAQTKHSGNSIAE